MSITALLAATITRRHIIAVLTVRYAVTIRVSTIYAEVIADTVAINVHKICCGKSQIEGASPGKLLTI